MPQGREEEENKHCIFTAGRTWPFPSTITPKGMKFTIWVDPSSVIISIHKDPLIYRYVWEYRGRFLKKKYINLPQNYLPLGWGLIKLTKSCPLTIQMLDIKFGKDWPGST